MVTIQKEEQEKKFYIEASPKGKTLNVRDELYNLVKNETLLYYSGTWLNKSANSLSVTFSFSDLSKIAKKKTELSSITRFAITLAPPDFTFPFDAIADRTL